MLITDTKEITVLGIVSTKKKQIFRTKQFYEL